MLYWDVVEGVRVTSVSINEGVVEGGKVNRFRVFIHKSECRNPS